MLGDWDGTLARIHEALYVAVRAAVRGWQARPGARLARVVAS
jgi:hypothetical protein